MIGMTHPCSEPDTEGGIDLKSHWWALSGRPDAHGHERLSRLEIVLFAWLTINVVSWLAISAWF